MTIAAVTVCAVLTKAAGFMFYCQMASSDVRNMSGCEGKRSLEYRYIMNIKEDLKSRIILRVEVCEVAVSRNFITYRICRQISSGELYNNLISADILVKSRKDSTETTERTSSITNLSLSEPGADVEELTVYINLSNNLCAVEEEPNINNKDIGFEHACRVALMDSIIPILDFE